MTSLEARKPAPEWLFTDPISLALLKFVSARPKHNEGHEQYASALVTDSGKILSISRNMQVKKNEGWFIVQGYANHAEMMAYSVANLLYPESVQGVLYVIGFLSNDSVFVHKNVTRNGISTPRFTCIRCAKKVCEHQINGIVLPTAESWQMLDSRTALSTATEFENEAKIRGKSSARIAEQISLTDKSVHQFNHHLHQNQPPDILRAVENNFELSPFAAEVIRRSGDGYIQTREYKTLVFQMASQSKKK
ncbi:MAG: hypothetical protein H6773_02030 [Pseudomonadales bacterium]|nr:hypothetical protein [Candidatus Woesebacteria bacterium]MCB9800936.1 hypothetical protein [Pseudomonadales bacterium]